MLGKTCCNGFPAFKLPPLNLFPFFFFPSFLSGVIFFFRHAPPLLRYERNRGPCRTDDVDIWTARETCEAKKCHLNLLVADTKVWEQSAAYYIDVAPETAAFVKNHGLGFAIPYIYKGRQHEYLPDFIIRLKTPEGGVSRHLILELKGLKDEAVNVKAEAAARWVAAVNADRATAGGPMPLPEALKRCGPS